MKRVLFTSIQRLAHSMICSSVLLILLVVCAAKDRTSHGQSIPYSHPATHDSMLQNHFSSNDFDVEKGSGKEENFRHAYTLTAETENVLRQIAYDFYQCCLLTQQLTFYTHSPYLNSLSPLWNPSIPIAHRKLLI
jgi:hypothetical protein